MNNAYSKTDIEKTMERIHYEYYNEWVQNFALNLPQIWIESSARALDPTLNKKYKKEDHSAIVIGRGPSIKKNNHLELIASSNYKGAIVCCDGILSTALNAGITPKKFPNFYVVTIDPYHLTYKFYDDGIVDKYGEKIKGIFATIVNPKTVERARTAGISIHWLHTLFDYNDGIKSFNYTSAQMVRAKNHTNGLPAIQTGGNVGTSAWFVSWQILKRANIALVGINHGWEIDDPLEKIISHGRSTDKKIFGANVKVNVEKNSQAFKKLFKKIYNPDFSTYCIVDPLFQFYRKALMEFIFRSPTWVNTINATEGGSIFGKRITSQKLSEFLKQNRC